MSGNEAASSSRPADLTPLVRTTVRRAEEHDQRDQQISDARTHESHHDYWKGGGSNTVMISCIISSRDGNRDSS